MVLKTVDIRSPKTVDIRSLFILFTYGDANLLIFACNVTVRASFLT